MTEKIRIGIIGAGANTRAKHIPSFHAIEGVEIVVVCNSSRDSSLKVAQEFNIPRIAESWEEVVADPKIDAVCIGTWPDLHAEATIAALKYGKHVLTEARMSLNTAEAQAMLEAAQARPDCVAQLVPAPFSLDFDATIKTMVNEEALGQIYEVCATHTGGQFAPADAPMTWRQDFARSGYNVLTLGIFHEMIQRWLTSEPAWLVADAAVFIPERTDPLTGRKVPVKVPDSISVFGRYAAGTRIIYHFSGVESGQPRMEARLNGSKASLYLDFQKEKLFLAPAGSSEAQLVDVPKEKKRGWRVEADFIDSIHTGTPVTLTSFAQGVRYMRFTEAVYRSWNQRSTRLEIV